MFIIRWILKGILSIIFSAAIIIGLAFACVSMIACSGCGGYVAHNPDSPQLGAGGADEDPDGEDPDAGEGDEPGDGESTEFKITYNYTEFVVGEENYVVLPSSGTSGVFAASGTDSITIKIISSYEITSATLDFYYRINGGAYLPTVDDYTEDFEIVLLETTFYISCSDGLYDYETLLKRKWGVDEVTIVGTVPEYPYKMIITSAEGEEITIYLKQE